MDAQFRQAAGEDRGRDVEPDERAQLQRREREGHGGGQLETPQSHLVGQALQRLARFRHALAERSGRTEVPTYRDALALGGGGAGPFHGAFEALLNDLNTPDALGRIFTTMKSISVESLSPEEADALEKGFHFLMEALGLVLPAEGSRVGEAAEALQALAAERWAAKQAKNWAESDRLREEIAAAGWEIKDTKEGYELCPKN